MTSQLLAERYELHDLLGSGGMARVLEGYDRVLARRVAVKLLREDAGGPHSQERFLREARAAASFHHPNAVAVFDTGRDDGVPFIVMELVDGPTLADELDARGRLDVDRALDVADQVLGALSAAHRRGLVHRDVKPANIMLPGDGEAKLTDFGIAKSVSDTAAGLTQAGQVFGTPKYLSPEQVSGHQATLRSDVYAMGVVLYEMLAGEPPFSADSAIAVALAHTEEEPPPLDRARPDLDPALVAFVHRALEKDPEARFADAGEMREALRQARAGIAPAHAPTQRLAGAAATERIAGPTERLDAPEPAATRVPEREPAPPAGRRRRGGRLWLWLTVAALLLLGLVLGGAWLADRVGDLFDQIETPVEEEPEVAPDEPADEPVEEPVEEDPEPPAEDPDPEPPDPADPPVDEEPAPPEEEPAPPDDEAEEPDQEEDAPGQSGEAPGQTSNSPPDQRPDPPAGQPGNGSDPDNAARPEPPAPEEGSEEEAGSEDLSEV